MIILIFLNILSEKINIILFISFEIKKTVLLYILMRKKKFRENKKIIKILFSGNSFIKENYKILFYGVNLKY